MKWTITMDGLEIGLEGDWSLEFLNAEDYISEKVLTKDFFAALRVTKQESTTASAW